MLLTQQSEVQDLTLYLKSIDGPIAIDTETSFVSAYQDRWLLGLSLCTGSETFYIPVEHESMVGEAVNNLTIPSDFLMGIGTCLVAHEAIFDEIVVERAGIKIPDVPIYCTRNMSHIINEDYIQGHELSAVGQRYVGRESVKEREIKKLMKGYGWTFTPPVVMAKYAEQDARLCYDIYTVLKPMFAEWEEYWKRERKYTLILKDMIMKGIPFNVQECKRLAILCEQQADKLIIDIGFNPDKKEAISKLFDLPPVGLGLKPVNKTLGGKPQINAEFLDKTNHPICGLIKQYRTTTTQLTLFYRKYLEQARDNYPRLHPNFKQNGTITGRPSCSDPNVFQIPRDSPIKKLYLAEKDKQLWEIDYRNMEWRMAAIYSKEEKLINAFKNEEDMHLITAAALGVNRQDAKIGGFTYLFLGGWEAIVKQIGAVESKAKAFIKGMKETYRKVEALKYKAQETAAQSGSIKIWTGRRRHYRDSRGAYTALNFLTQGGSFEILKESMIKLKEAGYDIRNNVYDSVWLMVDNEQQVIEAQKICEDWTKEAFGLRFSTDRKRLN